MRGATKLQALTPATVDQAFALAREANSALSLEEWRRFAEPRSSEMPSQIRSPGVLLVTRDDTIRGIAAVEQTVSRAGERVLCANRVVVMDRVRRDRVAHEMLRGLFGIAQRDGCTRMRASLPQSSGWLLKYWADPEGTILRIPVDCTLVTETEFCDPPMDNVIHVQFPAR